MPEHAPALFERVPRGLFGPLGDLYAELYWELLAELYRHEFEREPFVVVRSTALDVAEAVVRGSRLWNERPQDLDALAREDEISREGQGISASVVWSAQPGPTSVPPFDPEATDEATAIRTLARRLVARLENTGWMHFQYRGGTGEIMSFHPYAARILQTLLDVARDEQPVFQGLVHSIAALLEPKAFAQRPGVSLLEARRHTLELTRELKILERNIHLFIQRVLDDAATAGDVLEEGIERYEHAVMANYHRLKTVDNVYRQRSAILQRLDAIERDDAALTNAADWYAAQREISTEEGQLAVKADLALLRSHFDAIPRLVDDIDTRNARFSGVALRKIRYFLRQDRRTEGQLQFIIDALAKDEAPELEFDAFRCELLGSNFLYTPPTARERAAPQSLVEQPTANRERIRQEAATRVRRLFARRRLEEFVLTVLDRRQAAPMRDVPVHEDPDYVRLLYLASYGLDGESTFELLPLPGRLRKGAYGYPDGTIEKRAAMRGRRTQT
ncbi:MAG TPA: Wadjet anti-phage system protein JetA family protein, partial [Vicinamibacterales bacterium]|nr:Wadjet anti-phage system protein JetA family protein [Vicinamibacterales bacterium]